MPNVVTKDKKKGICKQPPPMPPAVNIKSRDYDQEGSVESREVAGEIQTQQIDLPWRKSKIKKIK